MEVRLHKNATTTFKIREEIKNSTLRSINAMAKKYNVCWYTAKRWKLGDSIYDKSSRPNKLNITLKKTRRRLNFI